MRIERPFMVHLLIILLCYGFGLWGYSVPLTGDQKVYISTALESWQHGSWLTPWLLGEHTYIKPPFVNWMLMSGWFIFGFGGFGTFFPSALGVVLTAFFLRKISGLLGVAASGRNAGLWFAATFGTLTYGGAAQMEIWIVLFYSAAWWAAMMYFRTKKYPYLYLGFIIAGLTALIKSPLYSVFWVLSFCGYAIVVRDRRQIFFSKRTYFALVSGMVVGLAWFVYSFVADHDAFWNLYVVHETLQKSGGNGGSIFDMWRDFALSLFPILLIVLGVIIFTNFRKNRQCLGFLLSWILLPAAFFSYFPYRTETYLYILTPAIALFMDLYFPMAFESKVFKGIYRFNAILISILALAMGVMFYLPGFISLWIAIFMLLSGVVLATLAWKNTPFPHLCGMLMLVLCIRLAAISLGMSDTRGLRDFMAAHPSSAPIFLDEGRNWWNEIGMLSVAVGRPGFRAARLEILAVNLAAGNVAVLSGQEWSSSVPWVEKYFAGKQPGCQLKTQTWLRWNRGFMFPGFKDLLDMAKPGTPEWNARFRREYKLLWLSC